MTRMIRGSRVVVATLLVASLAAGQSISAQGLIELRSVQTVTEGGSVFVVIEADGPLPQPTPGSLENPPRLFFDFVGVTPTRRGVTTAPGSGVVRQTRIALFSANVTRVVLDLARPESYRIDASQRIAGRIKIAVGPEPTTAPAVMSPPMMTAPKPVERTPPAPTVPAAPSRPSTPVPGAPADPPKTSPTPAPPPSSAPAFTMPAASNKSAAPAPPAERPAARKRPGYTPPPSAPKVPAREIERYRQRLPGAIERLEAQQPIVMLIDAEGSISAEALQAALAEFTSVRRLLEGVKPSEMMASAHELLVAACTLGATATRLSIEATRDKREEARKNAASAAAGALMFFDRACADLACARPPQ